MATDRPFRFGLMAEKAASGTEWRELATKTEDLGYDVLVMPDHYGDPLGVIPALSVAAAHTTSLRAGSLVSPTTFVTRRCWPRTWQPSTF